MLSARRSKGRTSHEEHLIVHQVGPFRDPISLKVLLAKIESTEPESQVPDS